MKKVNVGVIGLGNMGRHHARNYAEHPDANLVAVMDSTPSAVAEAVATYGCQGYTTLDEFLAVTPLDAVSVAVPTQLHFEIASALIQRGISVLVEKPITDSLSDAEALIQQAADQRVTLMVGHIERFNPAISRLKEIVAQGKLGQLTSIHAKRLGMFPTQIKDADVVIDLAVHDIDVITDLFGKAPDDVTGNGARGLIQDRIDHADIFLKFGHQTGVVQVSWISPVRVRTLSVSGTLGHAELNYMTQELTVHYSQHEMVTHPDGHTSVRFIPTDPVIEPVEKNQQLRLELDHFLHCVRSGETPLVSGVEGLQALKLAKKILLVLEN